MKCDSHFFQNPKEVNFKAEQVNAFTCCSPYNKKKCNNIRNTEYFHCTLFFCGMKMAEWEEKTRFDIFFFFFFCLLEFFPVLSFDWKRNVLHLFISLFFCVFIEAEFDTAVVVGDGRMLSMWRFFYYFFHQLCSFYYHHGYCKNWWVVDENIFLETKRRGKINFKLIE